MRSLKKYHITTLINNAGFGNYDEVESQDFRKDNNINPFKH